ncbi:hypothetical protein G6F70_003746 [Rhizopus microsporus]|nr:hypothetical protein G6F71_003730 [Rhizopus microsporus]KAG1200792.1 hypothetical protein G6F70_003746 [Rhizopus microsporus]KAG1212572.1 hypothetical protein G6F69_003596 [Rhizopus microsporus]KAG1234591.1 hypothetical protein G6F67_003417 [Rhizopus microsporus]KAG1266900.1 hypothetical protein G6F68_002377 [Rhizopus microsporus]
MNIQYPRHMHSPSWDQSNNNNNNNGRKKDTQIANSLPNNQPTDSFFNRVFGHHSSESSRAGSPVPPPLHHQPSKQELLQKSSSRHSRNSSTGTLPISIVTPYPTSAGTEIVTAEAKMQRRRSFDGQTTDSKSLKPKPVPVASVSARVAASPIPSKGVKGTTIPFPRGGRQIGTNDDNNPSTIRRSNSIERNQFRPEANTGTSSSASSTFTNASSSHTSSSITLTNPTPTPRKRSNDIDHKPLLDGNTPYDVQRHYYQSRDEKKKSTSSSAMDQNFDTLDGIINPEYYKIASPYPQLAADNGFDFESWAPPDSWGVQPTSIAANLALDEDHAEFEDYQMDVQEKWDVPKKNANIKIYRPDQTYNTLHVPLNTTTLEIFKKLASKFFMPDMTKYNLVMKRYNNERVLGLNERPVQIQKMLQEQMGYTDDDKIDDISYLIRFQLMPNVSQPIPPDDKDFGQHVDLQSRSLATIPIYLYKHASSIVSLDISKNLHIEVPIDFIQMCTRLKQLWLANNEYSMLPPSTQHISSLEHLNISGNRLRDLDHAKLDRLSELRTLRAINNRLESLPESFATSFVHLTSLFISNNSFTKFPLVICEIRSLAYLDISFNKIQMFPDEIGQLTNLIGLFAIANRITGGLPPSFMNLTKLQELDIRQNCITDLDVVSHLPRLEILLVDYNSTSIINFEIKNVKQLKMYKNHLTQFNLTSATGGHCLTELNLSNCKLSSLPEELFNNALGLERLVLDSNTLSTLPSSIGSLQKLVKLSIQNNYLDSLPSEIGKLSELRALDAQKNNLKGLPREIWLCCSLQTLNCSSNLLDSFPEPFSTTTPPNSSTAMHSNSPRKDNDTDAVLSMLPSQLNAGQGTITRLDSIQKPGIMAASNVPQTPLEASQPPNFNPPSFFASPRNHPPPLSLSLRYLYLGDNRLTDDVWSPLSLFLELRTLNLSFNDLYEIPPEGLCHQHLYELYLSGNQLTSLPADDIEKLQYLRILAVNGNKLQTLPAEIGKLRKLLVLDVGNNVLKYNIANWPYDWNWNWNLGLKYLNLSGNKRLEIQKTHPDPINPKEKDLSDFSALTRLRMLGLMDITILGVSIPEEFHDRRVRTSPSEVNGMSYGVADWLGPSDHLSTWDLVMPRFRSKEDECIFALFDGSKHPKSGCRLTKQLNDMLTSHLAKELACIKSEDTIVSAVRRTFLSLEQSLGISPHIDKDSGASAAVCYIAGNKLYVANAGDALAVISRNNGQAFEITQKHIPLNPSEVSRIRAAGGYVSNSGLLNNELNVSRSFGHFHLVPVVNCNPYVSTIDLSENDEFVIMASRGLWDKMSYQTAVDIARTEKDDLMAAAQKLRDFAITYGANDNLMVMVIGVGDLFDKRRKLPRKNNIGAGRGGADGVVEEGILVKSKRRGKEEIPGDSTLARLEREVAPPVSQLALVFTDIKSSTQFWETQPENMRAAIKIHDAIMRRTLRSVGGYEVKTEGDAFMVCFKNITAALLWCFTVQLQLLEADWPAGILDTEEGREIEKDGVVIYKGLSVRMGIHWGTPVSERNPITQRMDYFGPVVNKASRICNVADGGQICVSSDVIAALRNFPSMFDEDAECDETLDADEGSFPVSRDLLQLKKLGFHVVELGEVRLKGLETPESLSLVYSKQLLGRIEVDKSQMMAPAAQPTIDASLSPKPSTDDTTPTIPPTPALTSNTLSSSPDYLTARPTARKTLRTIDPNLVCAMSNLAIRLERLTSGHVLSQSMAGSSILGHYTYQNSSEDNVPVVSAVHSGLGHMLDKHIREEATDEELMAMMENCVTRVENATSALYLQKMGRFANVLEKLGETIEVDPMHIMKALQMYAEVVSNHS